MSFRDASTLDDEESEDLPSIPPDEFEVGKIVDICYGETENLDKKGLKFKVNSSYLDELCYQYMLLCGC